MMIQTTYIYVSFLIDQIFDLGHMGTVTTMTEQICLKTILCILLHEPDETPQKVLI